LVATLNKKKKGTYIMPLNQHQHDIIVEHIEPVKQQYAHGFNWIPSPTHTWKGLQGPAPGLGPGMGGSCALYVVLPPNPNGNPVQWHIAINLPRNIACTEFINNLSEEIREIAQFDINAGTSIARINITFNDGILGDDTDLRSALNSLGPYIQESLRMRNHDHRNQLAFGRCPRKCPGYHGGNINPRNAHPKSPSHVAQR
jgi:hypothetical protein